MGPHLVLIYEVVVAGIGVAATIVCVQRAIRSGRDDHEAFVYFWASFTAVLIVDLVRAYIATNVDDVSPTTLLLLQAMAVDANLVVVATVIRYLHRLGALPGRRVWDALVLAWLFASVVAVGPPWGIEFDADLRLVTVRTGFWVAESYYMTGLVFAAVLAWIYVARRERDEAPAFLIVLALFATAGLLESSVSFARMLEEPSIRLGSAPLVYSSIPYAVYAVFLIVNGGVEEAAGPAKALRLSGEEGERAGDTEAAASGDPLLSIREAIDRLGLSQREQDVVALVLEGRSNQEIADRLYVSLATVKTHLYRIYRKAAVPSRYGLIRAVGRTA